MIACQSKQEQVQERDPKMGSPVAKNKHGTEGKGTETHRGAGHSWWCR